MSNCTFENPFGTIESAQEYMRLLADAVLEARQDVESQIGTNVARVPSRQVDALQIVLYNLTKLDSHIQVSRRVLNDLRTLRRLMRQPRPEETRPRPPRRSVLTRGSTHQSA